MPTQIEFSFMNDPEYETTGLSPLKADGFDDAIIGVEYHTQRITYSIERVLEILMTRDDMDMDEAIEFFDYNIGGAHVGEMTPLFLWTEDRF